MKPTEIIQLPPNPEAFFKLPDSILNYNKRMGKSEGRDIYGSSFISDDGDKCFVFFNKDDAGFTAYIVVKEIDKFSRDIAIIKLTWARKDLRQKGYLSGLIRFINTRIKMSIMSDDGQTPASREFWNGISKKLHVKVINISTGKILTRDKIKDDKLYGLDKPTQYRLFIESEYQELGVGWIPNMRKEIKEWVDPVLTPYNFYEDGDL